MLQQAINAIKSGDKEIGKKLLVEFLENNPKNEKAWLWMADVADTDGQRRECLGRVLTINPRNEHAWQGFSVLSGRMSKPAASQPGPSQPAKETTPPPTLPKKSSSSIKTASAAPSAKTPVEADVPEVKRKRRRTTRRKTKRQKQIERRNLIWFLGSLALILVTVQIFVGANLAGRWTTWSLFAQSGVVTQATVVANRVEENADYYLTYRYEVLTADGDPTWFRKEEKVSQQIYHLIEPGAVVRVQYLFENPPISRIRGNDSLRDLLSRSGVALLIGLAGLVGVGRLVRTGAGGFSWLGELPATVGATFVWPGKLLTVIWAGLLWLGRLPVKGAVGLVKLIGKLLELLIAGGVSLLSVVIMMMMMMMRAVSWIGGWIGALFKRKPAQPAVVWEGEGPPPLKQWTGTYNLGDDNYVGSFIIETEDGLFVGEGGVEIFKAIPDTDPKQVIAFDVGIFDKIDLSPPSWIIMSQHAYEDATVMTAVEANPNAKDILAQPGAEFTFESKAMRVEAKIEDMAYDNGDNVYFDKLTVNMAIFVKEGVDLDRPMELPDQFK
jgi:hypothetical protein